MKFCKLMFAIGLMMVAAALAPDACWERAGLDLWNLPKWKQELAESEAKSVRIDEEARVVQQRIAVKDHLVREMVAGRVEFRKVTEQFHALNSDNDMIFHMLREHYHLNDPLELSALNVIAFTESYLDSDEMRASREAVLTRIDREFDAMFPDE